MAIVSLLQIDDVNFTPENWQAFLRIFPLDEENPEDVSTPALKVAYARAKNEARLNAEIARQRKLMAREAADVAVADEVLQ